MILDHYTIHTADLERSRRFYQDILGLTAGYRPPFEGPPGAWLYGPNERPVVHLYAGRQSAATDVGAMDHIAFLVDELRPIIEKLRKGNRDDQGFMVLKKKRKRKMEKDEFMNLIT